MDADGRIVAYRTEPGGAMNHRKTMSVAIILCALGAAALTGCSETNRQTSPVELIVTTAQTLQTVDLAGGTNCSQNLGTINMEARLKNVANIGTLNDVKISSYRVSYVRTDGGKVVPPSFVRSMSTLLVVGGGIQSLSNFIVFDASAFSQAPFPALLTQNGGVDPETGKRTVQLDVIVEVFGQTLAGEDVSGSTRFPLTFCFNCGGCA
jgi:hypothetical protein